MMALTIADDLAEIELGAGNAGLARQYLSDALPILRTFDDGMPAATALNTMSACCVALADYDEAESYARESLVFSSELHSSAHAAYALQRLAAVAALRPQGASERVAEAHEHAAPPFRFRRRSSRRPWIATRVPQSTGIRTSAGSAMRSDGLRSSRTPHEVPGPR